MKIAHKIRKMDDFRGEAWLFRMDPPYMGHDYVIVSAINLLLVRYGGSETFMFAATPQGGVKDWMQLPGSFQGDKDIPRALRNAGYEIEETP
jgi:hypothetical protein